MLSRRTEIAVLVRSFALLLFGHAGSVAGWDWLGMSNYVRGCGPSPIPVSVGLEEMGARERGRKSSLIPCFSIFPKPLDGPVCFRKSILVSFQRCLNSEKRDGRISRLLRVALDSLQGT